ncbi:hypothetical protein GC197_08285 [bacterium]|nr:hypothetical protein [bacterium]
MHCLSCGANLPEKSWTCEYCGTRAAPPEPEQPNVFELIKQSRQYRDHVKRIEQKKQPPSVPLVYLIIGLFFWCTIGLGLLVPLFFIGSAIRAFALLGFGLGVLFFLSAFGAYMNVGRNRIRVIPTVVKEKRSVPGPPNLLNRLTYQATFEFENDQLESLTIHDDELFARLLEKDTGILLMDDNQVVNYEHVNV